MRYLRCIGGKAHGRVTDDTGECAYVKYVEPPSMQAPLLHIGAPDEPMTCTHEILFYTKRNITTPDGVIEFYAPHDWSDYDAIHRAING